jgi:hypothetical protein
MSILYVNEDDEFKKINIDDLYENKQKRDLKQISIFNKILNRIQHRIVLTGRTKKNDRHIWFNIPEYIFGEPIYDKAECIAYIINKLEDNGFFIKYMHPNTLFVSWDNWVPSYVRNELKKRRGITIDEKGKIIKQDETEKKENYTTNYAENATDNNNNNNNNNNNKKEGKNYTPIGRYKPTGNLVYNQEIFDKLEKKIVL